MKIYKKLIPLFLLTLLVITPLSAQVESDPYVFNLSEDHELSSVVTSKLVWEDDSEETIGLNLTMTDYSANNSEILIRYIQISTVGSGDQGQSELKSTLTEFTLSVNNRSIFIEEPISSHRSSDSFYLNITINAAPSGGGVEEKYVDYSLRFPIEDTIIIEQENILPVVNLYGFPQASFFGLWLPLYGVAVFFLALPGIIFGFVKLQEYRSKEDEQSQDNQQEDLKEEETDE